MPGGCSGQVTVHACPWGVCHLFTPACVYIIRYGLKCWAPFGISRISRRIIKEMAREMPWISSGKAEGFMKKGKGYPHERLGISKRFKGKIGSFLEKSELSIRIKVHYF